MSSSRRRLRVLHVIPSSGIGGAERICATILAGLDPRRFESWVATDGHGAMLDEYRRHASDVWTLDLLHPFAPRTAPKTLVALARIMRRIRCDVVHSHLWQAGVFAGLSGTVAAVPVRVSTVHGDYFDFVSPRFGWRVRRLIGRRSYRLIYTRFHRVIAVADFIAEKLATVPGYSLRTDAIVRIHTGFDFARLPRVERAVDGHTAAPVIATVARFNAYKGHRYLVEAMPRVLQRLPGAVFVLVGSGGTLASIRAQVARLGIEAHVRFVGESPDALDLIAAADLVVLPSLSEGLPLAALEAQALGKPVVASAVGGLPELIEDGASGLLVPPREPVALADAIVAVLSDPARCRAFGERGRAIVRERFSVGAMIRETEHLYLELATKNGIARVHEQ